MAFQRSPLLFFALAALLSGCADGERDSDGDGISDAIETEQGTDPVSTDTDGDGILDGDEVAFGTDPLLADTDGDGWDDGEEVDGNTDPNSLEDHPYVGGWQIGACRGDLAATGNQVGEVTSDFALLDQNGDTVHLYDFCDREVLLVGAAFW